MSGPRTLEDLKRFQLKIETQKTHKNLSEEYKSIVEMIRLQYGSLEDIRYRLSLSKRQIAKLLLVDPSAWTRWTRADEDAPPHVYQALSWYLQLSEKHPEMHEPLKLENKVDLLRKDYETKLQKLNLEIKRLEALQKGPSLDPVYSLSSTLNQNLKVLSDILLQQTTKQTSQTKLKRKVKKKVVNKKQKSKLKRKYNKKSQNKKNKKKQKKRR